MAKKRFQHPVGRLRKSVREVLALSAGYYLTVEAITRFVNELLEPDADPADILLALEWNYAEDYVANQHNEETEETEWCITKSGIAHNNVS